MLEGLVAGLLNRFLGMYVKNFDPAQLKVGIWSGDVKLSNLELRREALDQLKLPINVQEGHLGELTLVIPWSNLRGAPVKVFVQDVFLLAAPKEEAVYNEDEEERRRQRLKMEKLDSAELLRERSQEGLSPEEEKKSQSFTQSLVAKITDNVQITVKNIHIRYEDSISTPGHPFALGVTLAEFSAVSTDGQWNPTFIQDSSSTTHKLATLGALAVYWNTDTALLGSGREVQTSQQDIMPHGDILAKFKDMIVKANDVDTASHQFILRPVSGQAKIEVDKSGSVKVPRFKASLLFDEIGLVLDDHQYRDALMMVDLFHYFIRHQEYKKLKPKDSRPTDDPRAWFRFAGNAVLSKIHERNYKWSWDYFRQRRDDREQYIRLFKTKKQNQQPTAEESDGLNKLELKLSYEDLRFWRSLARNQLKKENAEAAKREPPKETQNQGWLSWVWGSKPQEPQDATENTVITEEQRKELYEAIEWDERTALVEAVDVPRGSIKLQVEASLSTGSFTLRRDPHEAASDLLSLHFDVFKAKVMKRPDSILADLSLGGLRLNDGTTPDSVFPEIIRVKGSPDTRSQRRLSIQDLETIDEEPFFQLQVEQNPLEKEGDLALVGKLKPLEIIWNPNFVIGVADFFRPPERHMESVNALMETAGATIESIREQTRAGLEFALERHKTINAQLDLQAPLIIMPLSVKTRTSTCLILDAGHISVNSELVDKGTMKKIQTRQQEQYTEEDYERLESVMYDKFLVKLSSTQVLIGPSIEETKAQISVKDNTNMFHVVEEINIDFVVAVSILPKAPNLTRLKVSGHLPMLHATASDTKYKSLMKIIDVAIPKFGSDRPPVRPADPSQAEAHLASSESQVQAPALAERRKSAQLPFITPEETAIVVDEDEVYENEDEYEDAPGSSDVEKLKLRMKTFEFKFSVNTLKGSLYRSDPDGRKPDQLLVELVAERFDLKFTLRPYDMSADVSLGSVTMDDFVDNPPAEFKSIVTSGDVEDRKQNRNLVKVKFTRVNKESPEFMPVYEGVEMNVDIAISTINLIVTRKTLLTLLDFILITFTNNASGSHPQPKQITDEEDGQGEPPLIPRQGQEPNPGGSIRVKVDLKTIRLILNNDGIRLATLSFNHADVGIFLLGKTMRIATKLGDLSLVDDVNQGVSEDSSLRQLVTIQGNDLADFRYETFDVSNPISYPGYDSSIYLRCGTVKINFIEEPFRKIVDFLVKFGKMQAIYNAARQAAANQASQIQQSVSRNKFDVVVMTPIVVFPRVVQLAQPERDVMTAYLGEIYAHNRFEPIEEGPDAQVAMKISAGIRNIRLTSDFHYRGEVPSEELEMIDHVDLGFDITYAEHRNGSRRPDIEVRGSMSDCSLKITQYQLQFLLEISRSIPAAFTSNSEDKVDEAVEEIDDDTVRRAGVRSPSDSNGGGDQLVDLKPELDPHDRAWTQLDLFFEIQTIGLEFINARGNQAVGDVVAASLSRFALEESKLKLRLLTDGAVESDFAIRAFAIYDSRAQELNKYRKIMTSTNKEVQQLEAKITMSGGKDRGLIAVVTMDSPRVIFALDYLFAIQHFLTIGLRTPEPPSPDVLSPDETPDESDADSMKVVFTGSSTQKIVPAPLNKPPDPSAMDLAFTVNIIDAQVILIANPSIASSEAIVLGTKQVLLAQQHALTFQISDLGMFLCRMDRFEDSRLRIIDDFCMRLSMDRSQPSISNLHVDVEPLILRLSLRDILLALQILSKASELSETAASPEKLTASDRKAMELRKAGIKQRSASGKGASTVGTKTGKIAATVASTSHGRSEVHDSSSKAPPSHEELTATVEGIRVVLIGDVYELPILDLSVKHFTVGAENWTSNLKAETAIDMFANVYNFSKSAWEPLIEPWNVGIGVARDPASGLMSVDMTSKKTFDITLTTSTIALASKSFVFLTQEQDVLSKPRGAEAPYRIRNFTGYAVTLQSTNAEGEELSVTIDDREQAPWSFEPWEKMRENLGTDSGPNSVTVALLNSSGFDPVKNVKFSREGELLYGLRPKKDGVLHRLMVDVKLGEDNVKEVTLRSPLLVVNDTHSNIELGLYNSQRGELERIDIIPPSESRPAPVGAAFEKCLLVKPDGGFHHDWSTEVLWWKDLLQNPIRTLACKPETGSGDPFYLQVQAVFDKGNPVVKNYPYMRIKVSAPVVLENLLPYDFKFRIFEADTKRTRSNFLRKGGVIPVHKVDLSQVLALSVDMQDTAFRPSDFAVIHLGKKKQPFGKEYKLTCKDKEDRPLSLQLHYYQVPESGGAFKVTVYSPYVILNKTGLDVRIQSRGFLHTAKSAAGQPLIDLDEQSNSEVEPLMFSFGNEDRGNRVQLKIGDSDWSQRQSFDAIGSSTEIVLPSTSKGNEIHIAMTVRSGEGKYNMTKVVTLAPRFILKNDVGGDVLVRQMGAPDEMSLKKGALRPLQFLQKVPVKQLCISWDGVNNKWTSPFSISDIGTTYVKIAKPGSRQQLVRAEILMEDGTIFIHLSLEPKNWPFWLRNESDVEFRYWQAKPDAIEEEGDDWSGWQRIVYRLPPRSIMPYAWDFPAAKTKELTINVFGKDRGIKLAEIGAQNPLNVVMPTGRQKTIDVNIAADGPTQTLILSNYKESTSLYRPKRNLGSGTSTGGFEAKEQDQNLTFRAQLKLSGIGVSLINTQLKELAYVTLKDAQVTYTESPLDQMVKMEIKWIQIDNQLYGGIFPMILFPSVVPKRAQEVDSHPSVHVHLIRVKDQSYGVQYFKMVNILLQQMTVELDEDFVFAVLDFTNIPGAAWSESEGEDKLYDESLEIAEPKRQQSGQDFYFEDLAIQPMQLDLSFVRTERVNAEDKTGGPRNPIMFLVNVASMAIGNVNDAPVRLNSLILKNARVSMPVLAQSISNHYSQQFLYQLHKILGSADFLGNPVGLFNSISSGITDVFYEPYQGLILSDRPEEFGLGLARGAASLVKKSVFGFSDSFSKWTGSMSKGLAAATLDKEYQDRRRITRARNRPKHALYGVTIGANSFFTSVASGVGGLARKPFEGAEEEGALGFFKGVGKGVLGLATKPAIGMLDLASNVSEGIRNTTTVFDGSELEPVRPARFIGTDGVVRPYDERSALGQSWLKQADNGRYGDEQYIGHLELRREHQVVVVTYSRILMLEARSLRSLWDIPLNELKTVSRERTGMSLALKSGTSMPFIPIPEESERAFLYRMIGIAVEEFNRKYYRRTE